MAGIFSNFFAIFDKALLSEPAITDFFMEKTFSLKEAIAHTDKTIAEAGKRLEQRAKDSAISSKRYENGTVSK
ncbi:MAG: hypothetical protein QG650_270 [Patescibacteria group bacterium]|nr:hypothetical protein [Patescibacteria group bacterium]